MKKFFIGLWFSLPIQLFLLHFRRNQVFLVFWYILFATLAGHFMKNFGADSLFLAPEYFNSTNTLSMAFVGAAVGVFIMSWNIATFILHSKYVKFLATTAQPFLKFCINNAIIPIIFLVFYVYKSAGYSLSYQLLSVTEVVLLQVAFFAGFLLIVLISFLYFFGADKTIYYTISGNITSANDQYKQLAASKTLPKEKKEMRVDWFLSARLHLRKPRDVRHYSQDFLDSIFNRHNISAVLAIILAFIFLIVIGYISDAKLFQIPAAASITILFSVFIGLIGALSSLFRTWSIPIVLVLYAMINYFYEKEIIDPRNKAYGIDYEHKDERPVYSKETIEALAADSLINEDKQAYIKILNNWKKKQENDKPVAYIINVSGGGLRSAAFTMQTLLKLDSITNGNLFKHTLFINGSSGGLLGAAYYRSLYQQKQEQHIAIDAVAAVNNISKDLLNPIFSSMVTRDIVGPIQKFVLGPYQYAKDRGFAFEEKLNENTGGLLNRSVRDDSVAESKAAVPLIFYSSVISRDARKMIIASHPARFLMKSNSSHTVDAVDFNSFFYKQNASNIKVLSALRMNATFPYVLPNVWLPTKPIIDVMDAGLRDNFGMETTFRFLETFKDWFKENTLKVILIQIRDRSEDDWQKPYENSSFIGSFAKPAFMLQYNWFKIQDYYQQDEQTYFQNSFNGLFEKLCFQYIPTEKDANASLNFHLTASEKKSIGDAVNSEINEKVFGKFKSMVK
ncbi:MAG: hypothetical protein J0I09_09865 [Sphingobacteriia bacterium]|nr:hypothetical protein [Sphingobacteriia bacterium]